MKKLLSSVVLLALLSMTAFAQDKTKVVTEETKTKKTSTVPQKVHNTFSKKKHYNGTKTTHKKVVEKTSANPAQ